MSSNSTALTAAESRVVTITNEHGDPVIYSNNPAELPGCRHEMDKCLERTGAFELLIKYRAARMSNSVIACEDVNSIPFITEQVADPMLATYTYKNPCPDTPARVNALNAVRTAAGSTPFTGYANIAAVPASLLKIAIPAKFEVQIELHAYALTQLSIFTDRKKAAELLAACNRDGIRLRALLDELENKASPEDLTLVTGRRDKVEASGLKGAPLTLSSFENYLKEFNAVEVNGSLLHPAATTTSCGR